MTSETQQNDMSMEDILSSIKDILENDSQEDGSDNKSASQPQANVAVAVPQEKAAPVVEEDEEDDVFDLSKSMIVEDAPLDDVKVELDETGPDFDITSKEDPLLSPDDIELPDLKDESSEANIGLSSGEDFSLWNEENSSSEEDAENLLPQEDDFNIDDILQSASDVIAEDRASDSGKKNAPVNQEPEDIVMPDLSDIQDIDLTSEPVLDEEVNPFDFAADTAENENNISEQVTEPETSISEPEMTETFDAQPQEQIEEKTTEELSVEAMPISEIPAAVDEDPQEIPDAEFDDVEDISVPEPIMMDEPVKEIPAEENRTEEKEDAADVSADIINNFAKMFAEQAQEHPEATKEVQQEIPATVSGMGNGNKTIEQVVEGVIQGIVASSVNAEMTKNVDIVAYAQKEIHAQTRAWLEANLPAIVEAAVQKEIERVMAKVGK